MLNAFSAYTVTVQRNCYITVICVNIGEPLGVKSGFTLYSVMGVWFCLVLQLYYYSGTPQTLSVYHQIINRKRLMFIMMSSHLDIGYYVNDLPNKHQVALNKV